MTHDENGNIIICRQCGESDLYRHGYDSSGQRWHCKCCGMRSSNHLITQGEVPTEPKVLLLDIETTPMQVFVWGLWKQRISHESVIEDWNILSWSAKWLFDSEIMSDVLSPKESKNRDDSRIVKSIWSLLDEAHVVIAHNGNNFDLKGLNTRFILNGLDVPMPYMSIDTLKVARRHFRFSSNRLDYLGQIIKNKRKIKTDYELWLQCLVGDRKALKKMVEYNQYDVVLLEEIYMALRPWMKSHPNLGLFVETEDSVCPSCTSNDLAWGGNYATPAGMYDAFRCKHCGSIGRKRHTKIHTDKRKNLTVSTAR